MILYSKILPLPKEDKLTKIWRNEMSYNSFATYAKRLKEQRAQLNAVPNAQSLYYRDKEEEEEEEKNKGGFFGGLGYFFEKIGLGFMQGIEGIVDYTVGGVADLVGAEEFAEDVIGTDWMNYNHADEWFDPSEGWKVAGDVAGGIGTSLPGMLTTVGLAAATGGASLAVTAAGLGVSGLSAAGTSTKEAYQETGKLGGAEFGYGALSGAVEAGTELLTGKVLGTGLTKAANATTSALGKGATAFAKTVGKNAAFGMAKEFASEAFEEGFAEWISPYIKRLTYDPNAEKATAEEIAYAALVGGLAGVATGAGTSAVVRGKNTVSGFKADKKGETSAILDKAQLYMGEDAAAGTDFKETVEKIYKKYQDTTGDGALAKVKRARLLGELKSAEVNGAMSGMVKRSAISATQNAEAIAQRLNSDGRYKMVDGKLTFVADSKNAPTGDNVRDITAEDIRRGYDPSKKNSLDKALKDNEVLRYVAASDAAGRFMLQATEVENATLRGEQIRNETEYKRLREEASPEARAAMSRELGIDLNTASLDDFNAAVKAYKESGKADAYQAKIKRVEEIKSKKDSKAYAIPRAISLADGGIRHYTDGQSNIAIARDGESFIIYDYDSGKVSRSLTRAEVNKALAKYREGTMNEAAVTSESAAEVKSENANNNENLSSEAKNSQNGTEIEIKDEKISKPEAEAKKFDALAPENVQEKAESASNIWEKGVTEADRKAATEARKQAAEIDSYAKENIKDYDNLSRANKLTVRDVIRKARESGISEADALSYARVAARTGLDIQFNQKECYKGKNEAGEDVYHAGFYDPENNRIVINPKTEKKHTVLLIHELSHAMRSYLKNGEVKYFIDDAALKIDKKTGKLEKGEVKLSPEMWAAVKKYYTDKNGKLDTELALDEASAYYAEALFGTEGAIDLLLGEKPSLRQKILSFFTKSAEYYSTDTKLSKEARRHFKKFKAMFDSFALRNTVNNTDVAAVGGKAGRRYSFSSIAFSFHGVDNMTAAEFEAKDYKKTEGYKAYVDECLNNMRQTQKGFDEKKAKKYIEDSIDGIVSVAVAMKKAGYDIADTAEQRSARDTKDRLLFSSLEPNSDYFTSSDISTICDKRQNFAEIYDEIVKAEEAKGVPKGKRFFDNVDNYFYIHKVLADKGLTQPCRQCYVESMRKNLAPMANAFLTLVQESDGNNTKNAQLYNQSGKDKGKIKSNNAATREEVRKILDGYGFSPEKLTVKMLTTADGLAEIKLTMPELYERFNSFYGQSKPKMPKGATPFRFGELTALLTDNKGRIKEGLVKKINSTGGFRLQSYSDFQTKNYADVLQVLFEASTLGLNGHAYTKVPAFLDATADTNLKRNISIFMYNDGGKWKIDRNDSFPYTLEQIYDVVKADKSGNTGIIAVVQNEDMAAYVMANDNIGYFIPFHKSGIKMGVVRETTVKEGGREIKGYKNIKDHTRQQTEVWAKTTEEHKANTKVSNPINIYEEGFWDFENADGLSRNELIEKNVKAYIDECEKRGYLPKFREYVMNNERVLNSVLSYAKELGTVAETATVDDISFEYKGYRIPYGYYKCLGDFSMITPDGKASGIEPLSLENYKFDKAVKYFSDAESVRRNEILQQFANGNEREYYRDSTMSAEELQKVLDTKRTEVVNEIVGKSARRASAELDNSGNSGYNKITNKNAKEQNNEQGSQNSGILEGQILSTVSESQNDQRQRGNDTQNIREGMARNGDTSGYNTRSDSDRKNVSGYLSRTDIISQGDYNGYEKSVLRGLEGKLADRDSSGRRIPKEIREQFKNTALKNEKGELLSVFHWTNKIFVVFKYGDVGYHFGIYEAALDIRKSKEIGADRVKEVYLNIKKPIFLEDFGSWDAYSIATQLWQRDLIDYDTILQLQRTRGYVDGVYDSEASKAIRKVLDDLGYDGIIYQNTREAIGTLSVMALYPDQVYTVAENGVDLVDDSQEEAKSSRRYSAPISNTSADIEASRASIVMDMDKRYKPSKSEAVSDFFTNFQIQTTNAQAGIEKVLKKNGVKDAEALVQMARAASNAADSMLGREQYRIGAEKNEDKVMVGRGLSEIMKPIENATAIEEEVKNLPKDEAEAKREEYKADFFTYLFHEHNVDRMSLRSRQIEWMKEDLVKLESEVNELEAKKKELAEALGKENTKEGKKRIRKEIAENRKALDKTTNEYAKTKVNIEAAERFVELEATKNEISEEIKGLKKELEAEGITKDEKKAIADDLKSARNKLGDVKREMTNLKVIMSDNGFELAVDKPVIGRAVDENGNTVVSTVDDEDTDGTDEGASKPKVQPYTSEESRAIADELLKKHPEFAKSAEELWGFSRNLNQYRVDTGLITQEQFDYMQKLYPHYVPTYREGSAQGIAALKGKYDVAVKSTVKSATGSVRPLLRPDVIIARQTMETVRAGAINKLARVLHDAAGNTEDVTVIEKKKVSSEEAAEIDITEVKPKNNRVIFFRDGEKIELQVTKEIFAGFDDFNSKSKDGALIGTAAWITDKYKKLVTSYSPLFIIRNMVRDLQDAGINTKYAKKFAKNYIRAINQIRKNGEYWQLYRAMGGLGSSLFDFDRGYSTTTNKKGLPTKKGMVRKFFQSIENANVFVEQLPRLAEFMSAMQSGKSAEQALLDAADVTTNFGRGGKLVKAFNRTFVPFLNPAVQGFSKIVRMITSIRSMREFSSLLFKCAILGIVPIILNQLMYGDDEDYEKLRESDKENNFLIKLPNNTFIKIPRGRVTSVLAGLYNRPAAAIKGEDVDWGDYLDNVSTQISPVDGGIPRDIFSPIRDIYSNKTWYGTDIENQSDELVAPGERYDESTSEIAKLFGRLFPNTVSPKKLNYLLDQYTGVVGDIVLPATSNKANRGYFLGNTTIDPTTQNKLSSSFYDAIDGVTYIKNSKSGKYTEEEMLEARAVSKYYNDVKQKISDLNEKKREINNNSKLSNSEKRKQIDVIQTMINEYYKEALTDASAVANVYSTTDTLGTGDIYSNYVTSIKGEENFAETYENLRYIETIKQLYGSETALSEYNKSVYEKSQLYNALGISYDKYYDYYFSTKGIESDVDKQGNTIAGSKKTKVLKAIKRLGGSKSQQVLMLYAAGYTVQDGDIKGVSADRAKTILLNAIMKLNVTKAEKAEIAKSFGFTVKNGKIIKDF
jgi:hypothetical protein